MNIDPMKILERTKTIAIVGCSATPGKDAHEIPKFLSEHFEVFPVNPTATEIFGRKAYPSLADVPGPIDLVNVFRPSAEAADIASQAAAKGAKAFWLQTGITSQDAQKIATDAHMAYVEDACARVVMTQLLHTREDK